MRCCFWSMEYRPPPWYTTAFWYVIHYHVLHLSCYGSCVSRGKTASYKKKCKIVYSPIKKYRDIHKNLNEEDMLYISSPDTTKFDVTFAQWMQNLIKMRRLKKLSKDGYDACKIVKRPYSKLKPIASGEKLFFALHANNNGRHQWRIKSFKIFSFTLPPPVRTPGV